MSPELRTKIIEKLTTYLGRIPHENEIINGQNDSNLMHWITQDTITEQKNLLEAVATGANLDLTAIKASLSDTI